MSRTRKKESHIVNWKSTQLLDDSQLNRALANALLTKQRHISEKALAENRFSNLEELQSFFDGLRQDWLADLRDNLIEYTVMPLVLEIDCRTEFK